MCALRLNCKTHITCLSFLRRVLSSSWQSFFLKASPNPNRHWDNLTFTTSSICKFLEVFSQYNLKFCMSTSCLTIPPLESFTMKTCSLCLTNRWKQQPFVSKPKTPRASWGRKPPKNIRVHIINSRPLHWTWSLYLDPNVEEYKWWAALPWHLTQKKDST